MSMASNNEHCSLSVRLSSADSRGASKASGQQIDTTSRELSLVDSATPAAIARDLTHVVNEEAALL